MCVMFAEIHDCRGELVVSTKYCTGLFCRRPVWCNIQSFSVTTKRHKYTTVSLIMFYWCHQLNIVISFCIPSSILFHGGTRSFIYGENPRCRWLGYKPGYAKYAVYRVGQN